MTDPPSPAARLDPAALFGQALVFRAEPAYDHWLHAEHAHGAVYLRLNPTFPDDPLYSLQVDADETVEFDDLPPAWRREGPLEWSDPEPARRPGFWDDDY